MSFPPIATVSDQQSLAVSRDLSARPRLAVYGPTLLPETTAALFAEFEIVRGFKPAAAIAVLGARRAERRARTRAAAFGLPLAPLNQGLLRAPPRGGGRGPLLSITARAIEGPASPLDRLSAERVLSARGWESPVLLSRATSARSALVAQRVGGEWWHSGELPAAADQFVLAPDGADPAIIAVMLEAALSHSPPWRVMLAPLAGRLPSTLGAVAAARGCAVMAAAVDPWQLVERARRVYTVGCETGFLALIAGCEVHAFGPAFYVGWGLTTDHRGAPQRGFRRSLDEIFAGACLVATRCLDPFYTTAAAFEDVVGVLSEWRRIETANRRVVAVLGMSFWKRRRIADFLRTATGPPVFCRSARTALARAAASPGSAIAVWASRMPEGLTAAAARQGAPLLRVEDGFVRSVGLGADFTPAASLVFDQSGIYYDPRCESDLERLLRETEFDPALIGRARWLIARLIAGGVTKYNLGASAVAPVLEFPSGRRRFLVPGQVEDDLSVRYAGGEIHSNRALLARVRALNPDAFILYKPHPDVEAGHRRGAVPDPDALSVADRVVRGVSMAALLGEVDDVHTLTSLTGFEALLRGRRVVVYGRPFYAGWGLTTDLAGSDRGRRLSLEELVAGALILYPRYVDPKTRLPCPPEIAIERLQERELWRPGPLIAARRLQGLMARRWRGQRAAIHAGASRPLS